MEGSVDEGRSVRIPERLALGIEQTIAAYPELGYAGLDAVLTEQARRFLLETEAEAGLFRSTWPATRRPP